jgi:parvulin-like peptidyl-prolyl isomerase
MFKIKKKYVLYLLVFSILIHITGCSSESEKTVVAEKFIDSEGISKDSLPKPSGGFVYSVKNETVTSAEVIQPLIGEFRKTAQQQDFEQFSKGAKPYVEREVIRALTNLLVYQKAKAAAGEQIEEPLEQAVKGKVREFVVNFDGDYSRAEQALRNMGMSWKQFREHHKRMLISQSYLSSKLPEQKPVTLSEIRNYYNKKGEDFTSQAQIKIQLIDINPMEIEITDANKSRMELAEEKALKLLSRIRAGEDFAEIAKEHSNGHRAIYGGVWDSVNPESLAAPYDALAEKAENIQIGELSDVILEGGHYFIFRVLEKQSKRVKPFNEVQQEIKAEIEAERRSKAISKLNQSILEEAALNDIDEFKDFCLRELYLQCNRQLP